MQRYYLPDRYRRLTIEEEELMGEAIRWLAKKHLKTEEIRNLSVRQVDIERKQVHLLRTGKRINVQLNIGYSDSPLEWWLKRWPALKSSRFIFPVIAFTGRRPELCRQISLTDTEAIIRTRTDERILTFKSLCAILKISKVNLHITN